MLSLALVDEGRHGILALILKSDFAYPFLKFNDSEKNSFPHCYNIYVIY